MSTHDAPYQYSPLTGPTSIRVLVVSPALRRSDPIECSFVEVSLDDDENAPSDTKQEYEALSYTWGAAHGTRPVLCEGRTILVTPNCEQALLHLRRKLQPRHVWIDAICINQQCLSEKNLQVPMMSDIYRRASRTIMWLGPDTDSALSGALRRASKYGGYVNSIKRGYRYVRGRSPGSAQHNSRWKAPILSPAESERIARLLSNDWFGRMWTIQEFLLSKSAVFRMGDAKCASDDLLTYYCMGKNLVNRSDLEHFRMRNVLSTFNPSIACEYFLDFAGITIYLVALNNATDARDKVYGIVAYLKHNYPDLRLADVDYAKSVLDVYELFTRSIITATGDLWALELIISAPRSPSSADDNIRMPSWVLDLRDPNLVASPPMSARVLNPPEIPYDALSPSYNPGRLAVRAKKVARVTKISSRMPFWDPRLGQGYTAKEMDLARTECLSEWTAFATSLDLDDGLAAASPYCFLATRAARKRRHGYTRASPEPCSNPYVRAIESLTDNLDHLRLRHEPVDEDSVSIADQWSRSDKQRQKLVQKAIKKKQKIKKKAEKDLSFFDEEWQSHDRCMLFLTKSGHFGECEGDVQVNDGIYLLEGSKCLFILRRVGRGKEFVLVGKTSIYRPNEEAWDSSKLVEDPEAKNIVLV